MRAGAGQVGELIAWAAHAQCRTWAVESAQGIGYLLAQQLVAAGEHVVDVPATLAARCVLCSSRSNEDHLNDALVVAIAALHAPALPWCTERITAVCRLVVRRHGDLARCATSCVVYCMLSSLSSSRGSAKKS